MKKTVTVEKELNYDAPELEVVEVMVEKGFAGSILENPEMGEEEGI